MADQTKSTPPGGADDFASQAEGKSQSIVREFFDFLRYNKKWWLTPIVLVLLLVGILVVLGSIFAGLATPTEAGALGALGAMVIAGAAGRLRRVRIAVAGRPGCSVNYPPLTREPALSGTVMDLPGLPSKINPP